MASQPEKKISRLAGICGILVVAALVVPRFVPNPEGGFASAANAVLTLILILVVTLIFSGYLCVFTLQRFRSLSTRAKVLGLGPGLLVTAALVWLLYFLTY
jgi:hypothetical protein